MKDSTTFDAGDIEIKDSNGNVSTISGLEGLEIGIESDLEATQTVDLEDTEYEFSVDLELETDETVCPHCNTVNHLPKGVLLGIVSKEPVPCVMCGYPLL